MLLCALLGFLVVLSVTPPASAQDLLAPDELLLAAEPAIAPAEAAAAMLPELLPAAAEPPAQEVAFVPLVEEAPAPDPGAAIEPQEPGEGQYQPADGQYHAGEGPQPGPDRRPDRAPEPASSTAAASSVQPVNTNLSIRILSPGDDGAVTQLISTVGGSTAGAADPAASAPAVVQNWYWNWTWNNSPSVQTESAPDYSPQYQDQAAWYQPESAAPTAGAAAPEGEPPAAANSPPGSAPNTLWNWKWNWTWNSTVVQNFITVNIRMPDIHELARELQPAESAFEDATTLFASAERNLLPDGHASRAHGPPGRKARLGPPDGSSGVLRSTVLLDPVPVRHTLPSPPSPSTSPRPSAAPAARSAPEPLPGVPLRPPAPDPVAPSLSGGSSSGFSSGGLAVLLALLLLATPGLGAAVDLRTALRCAQAFVTPLDRPG